MNTSLPLSAPRSSGLVERQVVAVRGKVVVVESVTPARRDDTFRRFLKALALSLSALCA